MYKYELHMHTSEGSQCGHSSGAEMVDFYIERGYSGMVMTDHFFHGNTAPSRDLPWEEYITEYAKGYYEAKKAAEGRDFDVFFGVEEKGAGWDEYIILGLMPEWYMAHPEIATMQGKPFLDLVRSAGAFVIHAHPYRERSYMKDLTVWLDPHAVDAIEVRNCGNKIEFDRRAYEYAKPLGLPMTGGSDNHDAKVEDRSLSGIELPFRVRTSEELIKAICEKKHTVIDLASVLAEPLTEPSYSVRRV